jgi:hypothetical protein
MEQDKQHAAAANAPAADDRQPWIVGPLGQRMTRDDLPPTDTVRWLPRLKAEVVAAVSGGLITLQEACERYGLSLQEYASWQLAVERAGIPGLRITRTQHYKDLYDRQRG